MSVLPPGFAALEPFVDAWSASGIADRAALRDASTPEARAALHTVLAPLVAPALDSLAGRPSDALEPAERTLLDLVLMFPHLAMAVEMQGDAESAHAALRRHMPFTA